MFILDGYLDGKWGRITIALDRNEIINRMIFLSNKYNFYNYKIIERSDGVDFPPERITNQRELHDYLVKYKPQPEKLSDMTCVKLKKYIIEKQERNKK